MSMIDVTEFDALLPTRVDGVSDPANGIGFLMLKQLDDDGDAVKACGIAGCTVCADALTKGTLRAKERHEIPDKLFAFPKQRKEPLNDESHVRNAISRFSQVEGVSRGERKKAARRIMRRAKTLGIDVSDDSDVAQAAKAMADQDAEIAAATARENEGEGRMAEEVVDAQTEGLSDLQEPGMVADPTAQPEGDPQQGFPADQDKNYGDNLEMTGGRGFGDLAPEHGVQPADAVNRPDGVDTAESMDQTDGLADAQTAEHSVGMEGSADEPAPLARKAGEGDGTGDSAPNAEAETAMAQREAEGQTDDLKDAQEGADAMKASPKGTDRHKSKKVKKSEAKASRLRQALLATTTNPNLIKEIQSMATDELTKLIGEHVDARLTKAAEKAAKERAKAAKAEAKAAKAAAKATKAAEGSTDGGSTDVAKSTDERLAALEASIAAGRRPFVNAFGATAALRGADGPNILKSMEDRVVAARERMEKASSEYERTAADAEYKAAHRQLTLSKMVAQANAQERGLLPPTHYGRNATALFGDSTLSLPDDVSIKAAPMGRYNPSKGVSRL